MTPAPGSDVLGPLVSVIMPVCNEAAFLDRSLGAVLRQDYPAEKLEVIVADGMSTDGTRAIVTKWQRDHLRLRLLDNPACIVPAALNAAVREARGEIIIRVDGHCEIAPDYVSRCVLHLERGEADGVGGSVETVGETTAARTIAIAMSSPFGVGNSAFRTVRGKTLLVDTVPFPAYRRALLDRTGPFDEELVRNQDDEYNYRLRKNGARLLLAADVKSRYFSRSSFRGLWRQYFQYSYWKVRVLQKHPRQMRASQFVPPVFVASLMVSAVCAPFFKLGVWMLCAIAGAYVLANSSFTLAESRRVAVGRLPPLSLAFATLHFAYGLGFLVGLARFWNRWGTAGKGARSAGQGAAEEAAPPRESGPPRAVERP